MGIRVGLSVRALRRRAGLTQAALGRRVGSSGSAVSRIERGQATDVTIRLLDRVAAVLGARLVVTVLWQGEALDRLLDSGHARLVDWTIRWLTSKGWEAVPEVTFQIRGERSAVDVLARHRTGAVLTVEVKSVVPDAQAMFATLDRKARLAREIALQRGWLDVTSTSRLLVLPADRTSRRRVMALDAMFRAALPQRSIDLRRWVRQPTGTISGVLFVSDVPDTGPRQRVARARRTSPAETTAPRPAEPVDSPRGASLSADR
jgi:transcriptional regulator with XRE-family HTH domain